MKILIDFDLAPTLAKYNVDLNDRAFLNQAKIERNAGFENLNGFRLWHYLFSRHKTRNRISELTNVHVTRISTQLQACNWSHKAFDYLIESNADIDFRKYSKLRESFLELSMINWLGRKLVGKKQWKQMTIEQWLCFSKYVSLPNEPNEEQIYQLIDETHSQLPKNWGVKIKTPADVRQQTEKAWDMYVIMVAIKSNWRNSNVQN